jgi:hypothetical protein
MIRATVEKNGAFESSKIPMNISINLSLSYVPVVGAEAGDKFLWTTNPDNC